MEEQGESKKENLICPNCRTSEMIDYLKPKDCGEEDIKICPVCKYKSDLTTILNEWDNSEGDNAWCLPEDMGDQ